MLAPESRVVRLREPLDLQRELADELIARVSVSQKLHIENLGLSFSLSARRVRMAG